MKKIIEYIPHIHEGGAESLVRDYALFLNKELFDVMVITNQVINESASNVKILRKHGVKIHCLRDNNIFFKIPFIMKIWNRFFLHNYIVSRLKECVKEFEPDVIHVHLELLKYVLPISIKYPNIRIVYTCHNEPKIHLDPITKNTEYESALKLSETGNFTIIALHDAMKNELQKMFPKASVFVVHNGVDLKRFHNVTYSKSEIRKSIGIDENAFVIGHIGRFSEAKNHSFLVDIFLEVKRRNKNAFLLMIGSGPLMNNIMEKIADKNISQQVLVLSNRYDIPDLLKAMDVFVFPSLFEGLPVTLVESQAASIRSVISSNVTRECFFSKRAIPVDISKSAQEWAEVILDESIEGPYSFDITEFDMLNSIKKLEAIYSE